MAGRRRLQRRELGYAAAHMKRLAVALLGLVVLAGSAPVAASSPSGTQTAPHLRAEIATGYGFATGDCCLDWFYGTSTPVNLPHVGPATLTTYFVQCYSTYACSAPNSQLTLTFEAKNGGTLVLHGEAPNLGTFTLEGASFEIAVDGAWTVDPSSTGRFATFAGGGTFS